MPDVRLKKMRTFLDEYHYTAGPRGFTDLPEPGMVLMPTVVIPKEQLVKFRNDFHLLIKFAALMCDKPVEELCPFDLLAPFLRDAMEAQAYYDGSE